MHPEITGPHRWLSWSRRALCESLLAAAEGSICQAVQALRRNRERAVLPFLRSSTSKLGERPSATYRVQHPKRQQGSGRIHFKAGFLGAPLLGPVQNVCQCARRICGAGRRRTAFPSSASPARSPLSVPSSVLPRVAIRLPRSIVLTSWEVRPRGFRASRLDAGAGSSVPFAAPGRPPLCLANRCR
jgi:hypothetical protein